MLELSIKFILFLLARHTQVFANNEGSQNDRLRPAYVAKIYDDVNDQMTKIAHRLCLDLQSDCNVAEEKKMNSIFDFWKDFNGYWGLGEDILQPSSTLTDLQRLVDINAVATDILDKPTKFCDRKRGFCCSPKTSQCVCPKGTTRQDSKCRILAGHKCDLIPTYFSLQCVKFAECVTKDGQNQGICQCLNDKKGNFGRAICEKEEATGTYEGAKIPLGSFTSYLTNSLVTTIRSHPDASSPKPHDHDHVNEVSDSFLEMAAHRVASLDDQCFIKDNAEFHQIAQIFSDANRFHYNLANKTNPYPYLGELTYLMAKGGYFCDLRKHLVCSSSAGTCQCPPGLFPNFQGECRIPIGAQCLIDTHEQDDWAKDFIIPWPKCAQGLVCAENSTLGIFLCLPFIKSELESRLELEQNSATNYFSPFVILILCTTILFWTSKKSMWHNLILTLSLNILITCVGYAFVISWIRVNFPLIFILAQQTVEGLLRCDKILR